MEHNGRSAKNVESQVQADTLGEQKKNKLTGHIGHSLVWSESRGEWQHQAHMGQVKVSGQIICNGVADVSHHVANVPLALRGQELRRQVCAHQLGRGRDLLFELAENSA
jgi:hypothetical protein